MAAGPPGHAPLEWLEQPGNITLRHVGTGIRDGERGSRPTRRDRPGHSHRDAHVPVRHVVAQGVIDEIGHGSLGKG
jgi:hypothetical protein